MEQSAYVHLLMAVPGQAPPALPASPWRAVVVGSDGLRDPVTAAGLVRPGPMASRTDKALVAAVATGDEGALRAAAARSTPARVLLGLLLAGTDPLAAAEPLAAVVHGPDDPAGAKVLHRHWPGLHVHTLLAPDVPVLLPLDRTALGLLLAEVCGAADRPLDAVNTLAILPPHPTVVLARARALLAADDPERVLDVTALLDGADDISALGLVTRSAAARRRGDTAVALDAVAAAVGPAPRHPAVLLAAVEERAFVYAAAGDGEAARADRITVAQLAAGEPAAVAETGQPVVRPASDQPGQDGMTRARNHLRRRISAAGAPGTFGGRHHSTYREEIAAMAEAGQVEALEELLRGLIDAVEDEVDELGAALDPTWFLTLADLYQDNHRPDELAALQERYATAQQRASARAAAVAASGARPEDDGPGGDGMPDAQVIPLVRPGTERPGPDGPPPGAPQEHRPPTAVEKAVRGPRVRSL